ncbi:MAG: ABC transporter ATP-binding protein [Bacillota bacterium]
MLKIADLSFDYDDIKILKNIDLHIKKDEFLGIIGPNGSGKSTLLKNISNILKPKTGLIYLDKKILHEYKSKDLAKKMAVVPQDTNVNFNFTVYDIIMMGRNPYQNKWGKVNNKDLEIVDEVMEVTDTYYLQDKKVNQLSGGERQRVIIARALAQKPDILLLDEPTSNLDINYQREIFDLISDLNKKFSLTVIVVSHDLNLSSQYCDKLILLNEGEIFATGTAEEVLTEKNIKEVYNTEVIIKKNSITNRPYVTLIPKNYTQKKEFNRKNNTRIHVIAGGGSATKLFQQLRKEGFTNISCGVLNQGDRDWETAKKLNFDIVEIPPFDYVGEISQARNEKMIEKAEVIIVTDTPFGHGNVGNLELLLKFDEKPIILEVRRKFKKRDYTVKGSAKKVWNELIKKENKYICNNNNEIIVKLKDISN